MTYAPYIVVTIYTALHLKHYNELHLPIRYL